MRRVEVSEFEASLKLHFEGVFAVLLLPVTDGRVPGAGGAGEGGGRGRGQGEDAEAEPGAGGRHAAD